MGPPKLLPPSPDLPMPTPPPFLSVSASCTPSGTQHVLGIEILVYKTLAADKACLHLVLAVIRRRQAPAMLSAKTNTRCLLYLSATSGLMFPINVSLAEACLPLTESLMQLATNEARASPDSPSVSPEPLRRAQNGEITSSSGPSSTESCYLYTPLRRCLGKWTCLSGTKFAL